MNLLQRVSLTTLALAAAVAGAQPAHAAPAWEPLGPLPASGQSALLDTVAFSDRDVWMLGGQQVQDGSYHGRPLALHFDGARWTEFPVPGGATDPIARVAALGPKDIWATKAGWQDASKGQLGLVHFDGQRWSEVTALPVATGHEVGLFNVKPYAADNVWVLANSDHTRETGTPVVQRYDGRGWTQLPAPAAGFYYDLDSTDARHPVIVGNTPGRVPALQRWDGSQWKLTEFPQLGKGSLVEIESDRGQLVITGDVVSDGVAGADRTSRRADQRAMARPFALRWTSGSWVEERLPVAENEGDLVLTLRGDGRGGFWAAGTGNEPYVVRNTGRGWTQQPLGPGFTDGHLELHGIAVVPGTDRAWVAGATHQGERTRPVNFVGRYR